MSDTTLAVLSAAITVAVGLGSLAAHLRAIMIGLAALLALGAVVVVGATLCMFAGYTVSVAALPMWCFAAACSFAWCLFLVWVCKDWFVKVAEDAQATVKAERAAGRAERDAECKARETTAEKTIRDFNMYVEMVGVYQVGLTNLRGKLTEKNLNIAYEVGYYIDATHDRIQSLMGREEKSVLRKAAENAEFSRIMRETLSTRPPSSDVFLQDAIQHHDATCRELERQKRK